MGRFDHLACQAEGLDKRLTPDINETGYALHSGCALAEPWGRPSFFVVCRALGRREDGRRRKTIVRPTLPSLSARTGVKCIPISTNIGICFWGQEGMPFRISKAGPSLLIRPPVWPRYSERRLRAGGIDLREQVGAGFIGIWQRSGRRDIRIGIGRGQLRLRIFAGRQAHY
jgi:hypothetical protein